MTESPSIESGRKQQGGLEEIGAIATEVANEQSLALHVSIISDISMIENLGTMDALIIHTETLLEAGQELISVEFGDGMLTRVCLSKVQAHQLWRHLLTTL